MSVCKTSFIFNSTNKAVYLGFVGLGSPKELGMRGAFRRVTSASQGMSLVKRMLGKALRQAAHTLLHVVILFFLKKTNGERSKKDYSSENIIFPDNDES